MQELTNYQQYQLNRYGNILPEPLFLPSGEVIENNLEEIARATEWSAMQWERQLHEMEYQHSNE